MRMQAGHLTSAQASFDHFVCTLKPDDRIIVSLVQLPVLIVCISAYPRR